MSHTRDTLKKLRVSPALYGPTLPTVKTVWFNSGWHSIQPFTFTQVLGWIFFFFLFWQKNRDLKYMLTF